MTEQQTQQELKDEAYETGLLDMAIFIRRNGGKKVMIDLLMSYPGEYMQVSCAVKGQPVPQIPRLFQEF